MGNSLYVNVTNRCPCKCTFCVRFKQDEMNGSGSLWLDREPEVSEIIEEFKKHNLDEYKEVVFCGYGEPLERIDAIIEVCKYIRSVSKIKIRINTNGLADLIHGKSTAQLLKGWVDSLSISLNMPSAEEYNEIVRPKFGIKSFEAMLKFAKEADAVIPDVVLSIVDCITPDQIERSKKLAAERGLKLRIREMIE
jgi:radical SAM enzyme (TIGR04100 family)